MTVGLNFQLVSANQEEIFNNRLSWIQPGMNFKPGWKFACNVPPSGQHGLLHNSFFQHDSELNTPMISTNIFFRKDDGIKIFDHQASSSEVDAQKCSVKKVFSKIS